MKRIDPKESLSRLILTKQHYRPSDSCVKWAAFLPNPKTGDTSVFRTSGISDDEIWAIGDREVGKKRGKPVLGRADVPASVVLSKKLQIIPSEPPERHANIAAWPDERSQQKLIAIELAEKSQLYLK